MSNIANNLNDTVIYGTDSDDSLFSSGVNVKIFGGGGNDEIYGGSANIFLYSNGDGDDIFWNVGAGDTISIAANDGYTSIASGSDVIINVDAGSMTLKNAADKSINIFTVAEDDDGEINSVEDSLKKMSREEFTEFVQNISHAVSELGDVEIAGLLDTLIEYMALHNPEPGLYGKAKLAKLSGSSIGLFAS